MIAGIAPLARSLRAAPLPTVVLRVAGNFTDAMGSPASETRCATWVPGHSPAQRSTCGYYSNRLLTLWSAWVKRIAFANNSPTDSTFNCGNRRDSGMLIELVTATSLIGAFERRSTAGPDNSACVAHT